jgi:gliding motility-associated lipoprotein GldH
MRLFILGIITLSTLFCACTDDRVFEKNEFISADGWPAKEKLVFEFDIKDTLVTYDVLTNIRIASDYPYSNLFLLIFAYNPDGKLNKQLIEYTLADASGKWQGKGLGDLYDYRLQADQLRELDFKKAGKYRFEIRQEMRTDLLKGIMGVGIRVQKHLGGS